MRLFRPYFVGLQIWGSSDEPEPPMTEPDLSWKIRIEKEVLKT